jgi:hypothetical protein
LNIYKRAVAASLFFIETKEDFVREMSGLYDFQISSLRGF